MIHDTGEKSPDSDRSYIFVRFLERSNAVMMIQVIDLVLQKMDKGELENLLGQLRALDNELDAKMEDIRAAQGDVTVWDRINVFTISDSEQELKEENLEYRQIRDQHGLVVARIKELIRVAMYQDFRVAIKIQTGEVMKAISALRVEHKWGFGGKAHEYQIQGIAPLRQQAGQLAAMISTEYGFPEEHLSVEDLLNLVYDDILRKGGFIE